MPHDSHIILVTKPSTVDRSLDDGVTVWITTSSRFLVLMRRSQLKTRMMTTNRIDKIHVFQQPLSTSSVMDHKHRSFARIEAIHIFHKSGKLRFQFGAELPTGLGIV